jgi:hypothetical protein
MVAKPQFLGEKTKMCGDLDEEVQLSEELCGRFLLSAQALLARQRRAEAHGVDDGPHAYMDKLFADALQRAARDTESAEPERRYQRLANQPLVFARLAGLLAGHLSLGEDPLRKVIEALMHGYAEAQTIEPDHGHEHDHDHDHHHGHGHPHGRAHHHNG